MNSLTIRTANTADANEIRSIYTPYVKNTAITFEYTVPTVKEFQKRIENTLARYPYFVALLDGEIVGYAYASTFKPRDAYDWSCEASIYVHQDCHGLGIGKALYKNLEDTLKRQNIRNICACIAYPNPESIAFHNYFGYTQIAHFTKSGYKFQAWHDMIWMEKFINEHTENPEPFIPYPQLYESEALC